MKRTVEQIKIPIGSETPLEGSVVIGIDESSRVTHIMTNGQTISIPNNSAFEPISLNLERGMLVIEDFGFHPMNLFNRWQESNEEDEKKRRSLIRTHQDRIIVSFHNNESSIAYIFPKVFRESEPIGIVTLNQQHKEKPFSIQMLEIEDGRIKPITPQTPGNNGKILHGTQIIGHVKDGCEMQVCAHRKGTLQRRWSFAFPPTVRTAVNQEEAAAKGVPTFDVTRSWSYAGPTDDYRSDFHNPESFQSVVGFIAANAGLCLDAAKGKYAVVSTNFRSEGQLLKLINQNMLLGGINFTFLQGRPGEREASHLNLPKFAGMLSSVQASLNNAPDRIMELGLPKEWIDDWWEICRQKTQDLDFFLFRTFSRDRTLPKEINGTQVIQIPHPIPEIHLSRTQAREHLSRVIGRQISEDNSIILLPGTSGDGGAQKRIREVIAMAQANPNLIVVTPMKSDDPRLSEVHLPDNIFPIGFRDDWMDIIPAGDVTFLRGSWGEILDSIAAGNVPIITSPGTVPQDKPLGETQFLTEISGERATNLSLLLSELQRNGVQTSTIEGLLVDINNNRDEITRALIHALRPEVRKEIRRALSMIPRGGIPWIVNIHEMFLDKRRLLTQDERERLEEKIWSGKNDRRVSYE